VMSRLQLASTYHGLRALHEQNLTARHAQGARP
jgi:hypothetical protein